MGTISIVSRMSVRVSAASKIAQLLKVRHRIQTTFAASPPPSLHQALWPGAARVHGPSPRPRGHAHPGWVTGGILGEDQRVCLEEVWGYTLGRRLKTPCTPFSGKLHVGRTAFVLCSLAFEQVAHAPGSEGDPQPLRVLPL